MNPKQQKQTTEGDVEWAARVGLTDEYEGKIGLFTVLRLVAEATGGNGYVCIYKGVKSSLVSFLHEADPERKFWELRDHGDYLRVWRRKEWNEAYDKQQLDEAKKAAALITQAEYNHAKETVMEFILLMCDGDKRAAEKMFYAQGLANDQVKLINKARSLSQAKEKREAESCSEERVAQLTEFEKLSQKMKGWKK